MSKKTVTIEDLAGIVEKGFSGTDARLNTITTAVVHIQDKIDNEMATKQRIVNLEDKLLTHIDGFIKLHQTLDLELVSLRHKYDRLEGRLKIVEDKVGIKHV